MSAPMYAMLLHPFFCSSGPHSSSEPCWLNQRDRETHWSCPKIIVWILFTIYRVPVHAPPTTFWKTTAFSQPPHSSRRLQKSGRMSEGGFSLWALHVILYTGIRGIKWGNIIELIIHCRKIFQAGKYRLRNHVLSLLHQKISSFMHEMLFTNLSGNNISDIFYIIHDLLALLPSHLPRGFCPNFTKKQVAAIPFFVLFTLIYREMMRFENGMLASGR